MCLLGALLCEVERPAAAICHSNGLEKLGSKRSYALVAVTGPSTGKGAVDHGQLRGMDTCPYNEPQR